MSAYDDLKNALTAIIPTDRWSFDAFESLDETPDVTKITMKVRAIRRLPVAGQGTLQVDWVLTITSPYTSRQTADPQLFDDLIEFVIDLDTHPSLTFLRWEDATKVAAGEEFDRLAYDITIQTHASTTEPDQPA